MVSRTAFDCQVGNTHSADFQAHSASASGALAADTLSARNWDPTKRQAYASQLVSKLVESAGGRHVVGDVSWVHTQYGRELLLADDRVHVVFQYRED